ncbi:response regulator transcription factor [Natrarchaeobius oligotrophus]|uniref:Response regulator n=1 Tax=Natrarchaeobius chitinivorans TaxID=1679083 RepID=A0A3N6M6D0_NATCH|nr:response regulator [Natrarchaeobius chitinivorans]RQG99143.1 response regulator [Natrarchaeobius chitinivorans]
MAVNVLIVDTSEATREVLREAISEEFRVVAEAADGAEAIEIAETTHVDVVVMDLAMPGVDGIEATATITELHPDVSVVFCTNATQRETMRSAIEAGGDGYVTKPFENSTIQDAIRDAIS